MERALVAEHFGKAVSDYVIRRRTINAKINLVLSGRVLEIGNGAKLEYYQDDIETVALDITPELSYLCKKNYPRANVIIGDVCNLPFKKGVFDSVVSINLLHHLVGRSHVESDYLIKKAICGVKFSLRKKGFWVIFDTCSRNAFVCWFMFYVTLFCAKTGLELKRLDIHSKVVTHFQTDSWLRASLISENLTPVLLYTSNWIWFHINFGKESHIIKAVN